VGEDLYIASHILMRPATAVPYAWSWLGDEDWGDPRCRAVFSAAVALWEETQGALVPAPTAAYLEYMAHAVATRLSCSLDEGYAVVDYVLRDGECFIEQHTGRPETCLRDHAQWALSEARIRNLRSAIFAEAERDAAWVRDGMPAFSGSLLSDAIHVGTGMVALGTALLEAANVGSETPGSGAAMPSVGRW
jgi:hypothetical protein